MFNSIGKYLCALSLTGIFALPGAHAAESLLTFKSAYPFDDTVSRLEKGIQEKGMSVFAVIDHAKAAQDVGLSMPATKVIIFGNPKAGTPLMQKHPPLALDLPLRVLVNDDGQAVNVTMHRYQAVFQGLNLPAADGEVLGKAEKLVESLVAGKR